MRWTPKVFARPVALGIAAVLVAWAACGGTASPSRMPLVATGGVEGPAAGAGGSSGMGGGEPAGGNATAGAPGSGGAEGGAPAAGGALAMGGATGGSENGGTRGTTRTTGGSTGTAGSGGRPVSGGARATGGASGGGGATTGAATGGAGGTARASGGAGGTARASGGAGGTARASGGAGAGGRDGSGGASTARDGALGGVPTVGAHAMAFTLNGEVASDTLTIPAIETQPAGSTILVALARGLIGSFGPVPTDNKGNSPYALVGSVRSYALWPESGTALYAFTSAAGGRGHTVTIPKTSYSETTVFVVEVMNASRIQDESFREVPGRGTLTSASVTTTGPATLVAICWGDGAGQPITLSASDGFKIIEEQALSQISIEGAVAVKNVASAGTYSVTWTATQEGAPMTMGALMYLVALEP